MYSRSRELINIDRGLELDIRRWYSDIRLELESLALWIKNTLDEWRFQDPLVHSCDVRIKNINSLLEKVDYLLDRNPALTISTHKDVKDIINDLVGARFLLFLPSKVESVHTAIMSQGRFKVKKVTAHYKRDSLDFFTKSIIDRTRNEDSVELCFAKNVTGYTGIHYVVEPRPVDSIYDRGSIGIYSKLEIQVRTLIQHVWSEIQHSVVYKGERADYGIDIEGKFSILSEVINSNDKLLDRLVHPALIAPSIPIDTEASDREEKNIFVSSLQSTIQKYEEKQISAAGLYEFCKDIIKTRKSMLDAIKYSDQYAYKQQVGELFLKGRHLNEAKEWYESCCLDDEQDNYDWTLLRLVEVCDGLGSTKDVQHYVEALYKRIVDARITRKDQLDVYTGCSVWLWTIGKNQEAIEISKMALPLAEKLDANKQLRLNLNYIYYVTDSVYESKDSASEKITILDNLAAQFPNELETASINSRKATDLRPNQWDTLVWFFIVRGTIEHRNGDYKAAIKSASIAEECLQNCRGAWKKSIGETKNGGEQPWLAEDELWVAHRRHLDILRRKLGLL